MKSFETLQSVAEHLELDVASINQRVEEVLSDELYWFPVRHHSPAVAIHLRSVILKRKPKMIFIEGPHDSNHLLPHLVDPKTKPPVAIYSSYRDDTNFLGYGDLAGMGELVPSRFSAWYPMLSYSPEYVALQTAHSVGAAVMLIDLPHYARLKPFDAKSSKRVGADVVPEQSDTPVVTDVPVTPETPNLLDEPGVPDAPAVPGAPGAPDTPDAPDAGPGDPVKPETAVAEPGTDFHFAESSFYKHLAKAAGFRSWNEAWDSLFEIRDFKKDPELFRREFALFCSAVRATSSKSLIREDGTLERERFMLKTIKTTMLERGLSARDCMVVCGGFHLFLDANDDIPPPDIPPGTVYTSIVPYSFFRVSDLSGYGAGNRAPQFYQTMWDLNQKSRKQDLLVEHVVTVLKRARKIGEHVSSADAISTCQHAEMLARLRGRHAPILDDIHDALITCCCKGDPNDEGLHLIKAMDAADIGSKIGRVTEAMGRLPVVQDFYAKVEHLELGESLENEKRTNLSLDKREVLATQRSVFFHRLNFLEIPFAVKTASRATNIATGTIFREDWALRWSPEIEANLVERSLLGDTIESASLTRLKEKLVREEADAAKVSGMLINAIEMDLPNLIPQVEDSLSRAIESDTRFVSLSRAIVNLCVIEKNAIYKNLGRGLVNDLIERAYDKACFSIVDIVSVPEDQQAQVLSGLMSLTDLILRADRPYLDKNLLVENLRSAAELTTVPFLRGAMLGILTELHILSTNELSAQLTALAKSSPEIMLGAGDFLDGIMAVSRTSILLGSDSLITAVDELLRVADYQQFLIMLPRMRSAFERLHEAQRDSFAQTVAKRYGLEDSDAFTELTTSLETAAFIAHIDFKVAEIMKEWSF